MKHKNKWIAYVGAFPFPWGQASSRRVSGIARSLAETGFDIVICSGDHQPSDLQALNEGEQSGSIKYIGMGELPPRGTPLTKKVLQLFVFFGKKTVDWLEIQQEKPSYVIVYQASAPYLYRLIPWCKKNNIPIIIDAVEWYHPKNMLGGFFGPFHISSKIAFHYYYPKCDGVIAISSFLKNHFQKLNCIVIRIPPTLDIRNTVHTISKASISDNILKLVYAGTPGKKDLLATIIRGVQQVDPNGVKVKLLVIGPSIEQVKKLIHTDIIPPQIKVYGKIPQSDVANIIQQSDFSVLLRESLRFAQAGFSTKFVESMANSTPVIANLTSDLGLYLHDGIEGLICTDYSVSAFAETLNRALKLPPEQRIKMRKATFQQAENSFDYRNYSNELSYFLEKVAK